jgi:hypothetical protein
MDRLFLYLQMILKLFSSCHINCIASRELADKRFAQRTLKVSQLVERLYFITKA